MDREPCRRSHQDLCVARGMAITEAMRERPMTFFTCFDSQGQLIARCQTSEQIEALRRRGRPIANVHAMKPEEAVVCSLTGSPAEFNEEQ